MKYKHLLFDADGTLFDYDKSEANALAMAFELSGFSFKKDYLNVYRRINHKLWLDFEQGLIDPAAIRERRFEELFNELHLHQDVKEFSEAYLENLSYKTNLVDGAEELIKLLWKKYTLSIITNGLAVVQRRRLESSVLFKYIDHIIISEEINYVKPSVEYFKYVFNELGNPDKKEVLIIGDGLTSDIQGGVNFGIDTCWFNPQRKPNETAMKITYEIYSLNELMHILNNQA